MERIVEIDESGSKRIRPKNTLPRIIQIWEGIRPKLWTGMETRDLTNLLVIVDTAKEEVIENPHASRTTVDNEYDNNSEAVLSVLVDTLGFGCTYTDPGNGRHEINIVSWIPSDPFAMVDNRRPMNPTRRGAQQLQRNTGESHIRDPIECPLFPGAQTNLFLMDYDKAAAVYQSRQYKGPQSTRDFYLAQMGVFTPIRDLKQIAWTFPVVPPEDFGTWKQLPDGKKWPVFVAAPKDTLYPVDFGRGTAIRYKTDGKQTVYAVVKEQLDQRYFQIELPKYYGQTGQVPAFMITFRAQSVSDIDPTNETITFLRRGAPSLQTTINDVRTTAPGSQLWFERTIAVSDVMGDYPRALSDLLSAGEVELSKSLQEKYAFSSDQQEQQQQQSQKIGDPLGNTKSKRIPSEAFDPLSIPSVYARQHVK